MAKARQVMKANSAIVMPPPEQAEFLGQHREQEVGVRLGQVEQLLHALPEPDAEPLAAADGDQRLGELEAAAERDPPRD